mgnify:CR=1 FL=1
MIETYDLDKKQSIGLEQIDRWLKSEQTNDKTGLVYTSREFIFEIFKKGYYTNREKEFLNELREQYIKYIS